MEGLKQGNILTAGREEPQNIAKHSARTSYLKFQCDCSSNDKSATTDAFVGQSNRYSVGTFGAKLDWGTW